MSGLNQRAARTKEHGSDGVIVAREFFLTRVWTLQHWEAAGKIVSTMAEAVR